MSDYILAPNGELYHYGVKGMKWGVRRYQNADGSLTSAGQKRLVKSIQKSANSRKAKKDVLEKTSDMLKEELERETSFGETAKKLRKLTSDFEDHVNKAYGMKNKRSRDNEYNKAEKAWDDYVSERNRAVDSLLGKYSDTPIKAVHGNHRYETDAKLLTTLAIDKLSNWRYKGLS